MKRYKKQQFNNISGYLMPTVPKKHYFYNECRVIETFTPTTEKPPTKNISKLSQERAFYGSVPKAELPARKKYLAEYQYIINHLWE